MNSISSHIRGLLTHLPTAFKSIQRRDIPCGSEQVINIPQEILDSIMDNLYAIRAAEHEWIGSPRQLRLRAEGRSAMRTCLFVSRRFRRLALARLYYRITVSKESLGRRSGRISRLHQVINPNPSNPTLGGVGPYIKEIIFLFTPTPMEYMDVIPRLLQLHNWDSPEVDHDLDKFISKKELSMVINGLSHKEYGVRRVILDFSATFRRRTWEEFPRGLQKAIRSLVLSPHLMSLTIKGIAQLPHDLLKGSTVRELRLQAFSNRAIDSRRMRSTMQIPSDLENLYTDSSYLYNNATKLKTLAVQVGRSQFHGPIIKGIMKASASSLVHLHLILNDNPEIFLVLLPNFRIDILPNLKSFTCHQHQTIRRIAAHRPLNLMCCFLNTSKSMKWLEVLDLQPTFTPISPRGRNECPVEDDPGWKRLDNLLDGVKYPALERVRLTVLLHPELLGGRIGLSVKMGESFPEIATVIAHRWFPRLRRTNRLMLDVRRAYY